MALPESSTGLSDSYDCLRDPLIDPGLGHESDSFQRFHLPAILRDTPQDRNPGMTGGKGGAIRFNCRSSESAVAHRSSRKTIAIEG
jgi:hypothetical protein